MNDDNGPRPAPEFVEWIMGLDPSWVTGPIHGLTPNQQLTALGNGVLPLQAVAAIEGLFGRQRDLLGSNAADQH